MLFCDELGPYQLSEVGKEKVGTARIQGSMDSKDESTWPAG